MTNLEPDLCWCLPQTWRPANRPVFGRSRCREQECGVFGQELRYEPRGCWGVRMVTWGGCGATGSFRCLEVGQLLWLSSGGRRQRLRRWRRWVLFLLCLRGCRCVRQGPGVVMAAARWTGPTGVRRRAWLVLMGSWPVYMVRTVSTLLRCSAPGHCSLAPCSASCASPCALQMADLARMLVSGPGPKESASSPRLAAI